VLHGEQDVTVSCAEGEFGFVYEGFADYEAKELDLAGIPKTRTQVMLNLANPAAAFRWWRIPADGVGLARMEFVVSNYIKIHPMALVRYGALTDEKAKRRIAELTEGYQDKAEYFVDRLARGLARIAASYHPKPVIVRMSDFKTNEYANLIGGANVRAHRGESDARVPRRLALLLAALSRGLRARMPRDPPAARCDGIPQCRGHDSVLPKPTRFLPSWRRTA
jgi:phosphoenolpyruvate synthase/pyruvate phosphate dikinase